MWEINICRKGEFAVTSFSGERKHRPARPKWSREYKLRSVFLPEQMTDVSLLCLRHIWPSTSVHPHKSFDVKIETRCSSPTFTPTFFLLIVFFLSLFRHDKCRPSEHQHLTSLAMLDEVERENYIIDRIHTTNIGWWRSRDRKKSHRHRRCRGWYEV